MSLFEKTVTLNNWLMANWLMLTDKEREEILKELEETEEALRYDPLVIAGVGPNY